VSVVLRRARSEEAEALGEIGFAAWEASAFAVADAGRVDRARLRVEFHSFGVEHHARILVAEAAGRVLGWGAREHGDDEVSDLWIHPAEQRRGVGSLLLGALVAENRAAGYDRAVLETLASNEKAIRFYERHGFAVVWRNETFSQTLGYAIDKVGMNKSLSP
jgi:ribosomal-protein-alanine N-acetyltransferase